MQIASLQEEIDNLLGSQIANSFVSSVDCGGVQVPVNLNSEIQYLLQHDHATIRTPYHQNQLANFLSSQEGSASVVYQSVNSQMETEFPNNAHALQEPLFGDFNSNPFEKFLSGIDQEVFVHHPWFKHNG